MMFIVYLEAASVEGTESARTARFRGAGPRGWLTTRPEGSISGSGHTDGTRDLISFSDQFHYDMDLDPDPRICFVK